MSERLMRRSRLLSRMGLAMVAVTIALLVADVVAGRAVDPTTVTLVGLLLLLLVPDELRLRERTPRLARAVTWVSLALALALLAVQLRPRG